MENIYVKAATHPLKTIAIINRRYFQLFHKNRDPEVSFMKGWIYGGLKRKCVKDIFPGIEEINIQLHNTFARTNNMSLTVLELCNLLSIIKHVKANKVVEIGTFDGGTTVNIAANLPEDGVVYTVDLPDDNNGASLNISSFNDNSIDTRIVGRQYKESSYSAKVKQVLIDSAKLTTEMVDGNDVDVAFIDGCHDEKYVQRDTEIALKYVKKGGVIVWHDYGMIKDVSEVVDAFSNDYEIVCIRGCRLAVMIVK